MQINILEVRGKRSEGMLNTLVMTVDGTCLEILIDDSNQILTLKNHSGLTLKHLPGLLGGYAYLTLGTMTLLVEVDGDDLYLVPQVTLFRMFHCFTKDRSFRESLDRVQSITKINTYVTISTYEGVRTISLKQYLKGLSTVLSISIDEHDEILQIEGDQDHTIDDLTNKNPMGVRIQRIFEANNIAFVEHMPKSVQDGKVQLTFKEEVPVNRVSNILNNYINDAKGNRYSQNCEYSFTISSSGEVAALIITGVL